ncbi:MAG: hypothetical protein ACRDY1_08245, partial [Acidimicrobiales bacterium]
LVARRRRSRGDPVRACCVLWGTWLVVTLAVFSAGSYLNSYYTAALAPAVAALCGLGFVALRRMWRHTQAARSPWPGTVMLGTAVTGSAAYAVCLLPAGAGVRPWLVPLVIAAAAAADAALALSLWRPRRRAAAAWGLALAAVGLLLVPAVASATVVTEALGPFDTPFQPASVTAITGTDARRGQRGAAEVARDLTAFADTHNTPILFIADTSAEASPFILASGREVLPIGGFTGAVPSPTLTKIRADITFGQVRLAIIPVVPPTSDPRVVWIETHCLRVSIDRPAPIRYAVFDCHFPART